MRLLLVEDDPELSALMLEGLAEDGLIVEHAPNAREGLSMAELGSFDALILDVILPEGGNDLERLRKPFQRGAGLQGVAGSGLGLALVDAVARQHGGTLTLSRASEGGLRAVIALPVA